MPFYPLPNDKCQGALYYEIFQGLEGSPNGLDPNKETILFLPGQQRDMSLMYLFQTLTPFSFLALLSHIGSVSKQSWPPVLSAEITVSLHPNTRTRDW